MGRILEKVSGSYNNGSVGYLLRRAISTLRLDPNWQFHQRKATQSKSMLGKVPLKVLIKLS